MSGKYTRKPRAEQINLFCRGATVFLPKANVTKNSNCTTKIFSYFSDNHNNFFKIHATITS